MQIPITRPTSCALALVLSALGAGQARGDTDESIYFSELPVVASVSRLPQRLADAPTAVTVIDREMLRQMPIRDLNDVFRLVPGFQTYPNNTEAARVTYHGMGDGDYANRVQVLIDGRSMYSPLFGGGVNWATLPVALEDIERIEVVRGTNAVSYGSNAYLGVINIVTVDPALSRGVSVASRYGNQNVRDYSLRAGGRIGEVGDFRFTFKQQNDDGLTNRYDWIDSYFSRLFDLRADVALSERDSLQFSLGLAEGVTQNGRLDPSTGRSRMDDPIRNLRQSDTYGQLVWRRVLSADSDVQVRYAFVQDRSDDAFSVVIPRLPVYSANPSGDEGERHELEVQHSLALAKTTRMVWGASWREDALRSKWSLLGREVVHREIGRVFGNLEWKPLEWFTGNAGLAGEDDSLAGFHLAPRLSTNFHINRENTLRFGVSRSYRTGSTVNYVGNEKVLLPPEYHSALGLNDQYLYRGDPSMPAERLDTWELGYLGDWRDWRSSLDVRLFNERIGNRLFKIDLNYKDDNVPSTNLPIQDVRIRGIEYQFKWQPWETTRMVLNQAFAKIDSEYLAAALVLPNTTLYAEGKLGAIDQFTKYSMPRRSTSVLLLQKLPLNFELSVAGYWQDSMKWSTNSTARAYRRFDMRLGYPFRVGGLTGELALTVQSLNGKHNEYKAPNPDDTTPDPDDRVVERRQWLSLRLDY